MQPYRQKPSFRSSTTSMTTQQKIDYKRIEEAIGYLRQNFIMQPQLDEVAEKCHLSPFHFQRLFTDWAGVSPKKFLQYLSVNYAKSLLRKGETTLFSAACDTGLSGTGRLHDLFVTIEGMTPGDYKNEGENLSITYSYAATPFGEIILAATSKGICHLAFIDSEEEGFGQLQHHFPKAQLQHKEGPLQQKALSFFTQDWSQPTTIKLHLKGTGFQLKVWEALLQIPMGQLRSYGRLAQELQMRGASRAVGTAIGSNPVAFLIPCHRVIQAGGTFGQYRWGATRKAALIGWEAAKANPFP